MAIKVDIPQTADKAWVGAALAAVAAALPTLKAALVDGVVTGAEWTDIGLAAVLGSGLVGAGVYFRANRLKTDAL